MKEHEEIMIEQLIHSAGSFDQLARVAYQCVQGLESSEAQSAAGHSVLRRLRDLADEGQRQFVERALEVMGKFPHFARPRAAVALQALKSLANERK